jgi:hypothetical protein
MKALLTVWVRGANVVTVEVVAEPVCVTVAVDVARIKSMN